MHVRWLAPLLALALVPLLVQTAQAADRDSRVASLAEAASPTTRQQAGAAMERAQALFRERAPGAAARRSAGRQGLDATLALRDVMLTRHALAPADREHAEALLARPTPDGDTSLGTLITYDNGEATPVCGEVICVHYANGPDADAPPRTDTTPANGIPDRVDQAFDTAKQVHDAYIAAGYRRPDPDGSLGGGTDKVDVYLADIGDLGVYGYCTSDQPRKDDNTFNYWAYCVIDEDFHPDQFPDHTPLQNQQVTLAHEYFHAVQYAYDAFEDGWFMEATATWAEDELFDNVNDNWFYLPFGQLIRPRTPLDTYSAFGGEHYGNWIFFRYLTERWSDRTGGMPALMLELMESISAREGEPDLYSTQAIQQALQARGTSFRDTYAQFAGANRRPTMTYDEGVNYPVAKPGQVATLGRGQRKTTGSTTLDHLTSTTVRFKPGDGSARADW